MTTISTLVSNAHPAARRRVEVTSGRAEVSTQFVFRMAKPLDVSLYDVLKGTALPPNTCPHCGGTLTRVEES